MDIGEVAEITGLKPSALRYYEKMGLIQPTGRNGLRRCYAPSVIRQLILIKLWRQTHFSLAEIHDITTASGTTDRQKLLEKSEELDERIEELTVISQSLKHIAHCPEDDFFDCPSFINYLAAHHLFTPASE